MPCLWQSVFKPKSIATHNLSFVIPCNFLLATVCRLNFQYRGPRIIYIKSDPCPGRINLAANIPMLVVKRCVSHVGKRWTWHAVLAIVTSDATNPCCRQPPVRSNHLKTTITGKVVKRHSSLEVGSNLVNFYPKKLAAKERGVIINQPPTPVHDHF